MDYVVNQSELYSPTLHENFFVSWPKKPSLESMRTHLAKVQCIFALVDNSVVGLVTAFTDETLFAFLPLLEVLPEFQLQGIGSALVKEMETHLGDL